MTPPAAEEVSGPLVIVLCLGGALALSLIIENLVKLWKFCRKGSERK